MLYLHDVWVNWFEGEENGYNVCYFHEWRKDDGVELLDQVPLIKVEPSLYYAIENSLTELPKQLLNDAYQKSYVRKNHQRIQLDYCFVLTDCTGILAVDTLGYQLPIRKSRLIPRQEQLVYEMAEDKEVSTYELEEKQAEKKEHHILSPSPQLMAGLTRKERQLKQLLFMALDQLYTTNNSAEIRYWYTEWNPVRYAEIQKMTKLEAWTAFYEEVKKGWGDQHERLCEALIKGQPFFEQLWELEQREKVN